MLFLVAASFGLAAGFDALETGFDFGDVLVELLAAVFAFGFETSLAVVFFTDLAAGFTGVFLVTGFETLATGFGLTALAAAAFAAATFAAAALATASLACFAASCANFTRRSRIDDSASSNKVFASSDVRLSLT